MLNKVHKAKYDKIAIKLIDTKVFHQDFSLFGKIVFFFFFLFFEKTPELASSFLKRKLIFMVLPHILTNKLQKKNHYIPNGEAFFFFFRLYEWKVLLIDKCVIMALT